MLSNKELDQQKKTVTFKHLDGNACKFYHHHHELSTVRSLRPGFGFSSLILVVTKAFAPSVDNRLHKMRQAAYTEPLMLLAILSHSDRPMHAYQYSFIIQNLCLKLPIEHL